MTNYVRTRGVISAACNVTHGSLSSLQVYDTCEFITHHNSLTLDWYCHGQNLKKTLPGNRKEDMHLLFSLTSLSFCNALTEERNKYENISDSTSVLYVLEITLQTFMLLSTVNFFL